MLAGCGGTQPQPAQQPQQSMEQQVDQLLDSMNVDEKIGQMMNSTPGIERLGIKPYDWWNEGLHGVGRSGSATVFPQPIGLGATFDIELLNSIGDAISDEARAKYQVAQRIGNYGRYAGLTFWSPNVNIFRDPRWGRGMETYGEDPYLTGMLGTAFVKGLQGDDPNYLKAAACAKHFAVHSGPEATRHGANVEPSLKDLYETYLPAFEMLVKDAKAQGRGYDPMPGEADMNLRSEDDTPSFFVSILPIVFIIAFCFIAVLGFGMDSSQAVIYASLLGALLMLVTCRNYIHEKNKFVLVGNSISFMMPIVIGTSIVVGFASVVANTEVYNAVVAWIMGLDMNPYVLVVIGTTLMCILCADCLGGSSSFLALMSERILAMGADPAAVHRLTSITSTAFDSMPHNGSICMILMCYGYEHKEGYKYLMISNIAIPMVMSIVSMIVAMIAY